MTPDERPKPQFEPPPWETEAFERFRQERDRVREAEDLERELERVRAAGGRPPEVDVPQGLPPNPVEPIIKPTLTAQASTLVAHAAETGGPEGVSQARIEAMLADLRVEEAPSAKAGPTLIYSSVAFMGTMGFFMSITALVLFAKSRPAGGSAVLLASMTSLVMLLTGVGCIAGAVALYRKHHQ
jgi:hypothetical protein